MTATQAFEVVNLLGGAQSGPLGITWGPLRVYCGSGIAGHSGEWWIDFPGRPEIAPNGPYRNARSLRAELRRIVVAYLRFGFGVLDLAADFQK